MFEIEYELEIEDLIHFNELRLKTDPSIQKELRSKRLLVPAIMLFFGLFYYIAYADTVTTAYITLLALVWGVMSPYYFKMDMRRQLRNSYSKEEQEAILGTHKLVIEPEVLREKSPGGKSATKWSDMLRVDDLPDYVHIFVDIDAAIIIPKKQVTSGDLKKFAKQADSMIERLAD